MGNVTIEDPTIDFKMEHRIAYTNDTHIVPFRTGTRMTNDEKINLLMLIMDWDTAEEIALQPKPIPYTRKLLKLRYNMDVPYITLYKLARNYGCEYDENHNIKNIYKI